MNIRAINDIKRAERLNCSYPNFLVFLLFVKSRFDHTGAACAPKTLINASKRGKKEKTGIKCFIWPIREWFYSYLQLFDENRLLIAHTCDARVESDQSREHRGDAVTGLQQKAAAVTSQNHDGSPDICLFSPSTIRRLGR